MEKLGLGEVRITITGAEGKAVTVYKVRGDYETVVYGIEQELKEEQFKVEEEVPTLKEGQVIISSSRELNVKEILDELNYEIKEEKDGEEHKYKVSLI